MLSNLPWNLTKPGSAYPMHSKANLYISLCSSIRSNSSFIKVLSWDCSNLVTSSGATSASVAVSTTSAVISSPEILILSKSSRRFEINHFQTPVNVDRLVSSHELWMLLMEARMVKTFLKVFNLLCLDIWEESLSLAGKVLPNVFLK